MHSAEALNGRGEDALIIHGLLLLALLQIAVLKVLGPKERGERERGGSGGADMAEWISWYLVSFVR